MKNYKILTFLITNILFLNASKIELTSNASTELKAAITLENAYKMSNLNLTRKGKKNSGFGFWDQFVDLEGVESRIIYFGPGEYVKPHKHDMDELFFIKDSSCIVGIKDIEGGFETQEYKIGDQIKIPAGVIHFLVAQRYGLCMHVSKNDNTRSVEWTDEEIPNSIIIETEEV